MSTASLQEARQSLRAYFAEQLPGWSDDALDTESLEDYGMDSTGIATLVLELEERYDIEIRDDELTEKNLGTIQGILSFLDRKKAA